MSKKRVDYVELRVGRGLVRGLDAAFDEACERNNVPIEAIKRLVTLVSVSTWDAIAQRILADWQEEQQPSLAKAMKGKPSLGEPNGGDLYRTGPSNGEVLPPNHYLVPVGYDMPRDKGKLEGEFSNGGVSELFYGNYEWQPHLSCAEIDQTPGNRVMLLKHFGRDTKIEANIADMGKLGYRPATHLEAYAFAKAYPELQRQFWVIALGSSSLSGDSRRVAVLGGDSDGRILNYDWFEREWFSGYRFLFVRK